MQLVPGDARLLFKLPQGGTLRALSLVPISLEDGGREVRMGVRVCRLA
jgi:hypothetical protein